MPRSILAVALAAVAVLTVACSSGGGATPAPSAPASPGQSPATGDGVTVVAKDLAFDTESLTIPADTATQVTLDNQEAAPHNIAIKDAAGATVFKGEIVTQGSVTYAVPALATGAYTFWCEVHPNMAGTLTVG